MKTLINLIQSEEGQGLTEYALIISLIILASIVAVQAFGLDVEVLYNNIVSKLPF